MGLTFHPHLMPHQSPPHAEDDGYLLVFVHSNKTCTTTFNIYDARTMKNTPLASITMPRRVPYGACRCGVRELISAQEGFDVTGTGVP